MSAWTDTTVTEIDGWEVRATTLPDHAYLTVRAIRRDRGWVLNVAKMSAETLATWSPAAAWKKS